MVSDALQDEDWSTLKGRIFAKPDEDVFTDSKMELFEEYLGQVDIHLVERGMGFKPAKSIEYGKTDQSMLNHIRNGILFLLRFNVALKKLDVRPLDEPGLRNCMALFVVHDLHKLEFGEFMDDEDVVERADSMETEFEISKEAVNNFVEMMGLRAFAPELVDEDYFSVAVALHKSRFSRSGARTSRFMDMEPFLYLMDNMASCASPEAAVSARSLAALRDGFPQDSADEQLNLQYHRLDDVKGLLSGIINKSVADMMEEQGLIMLMAYQDGCVYLGRGMQRVELSDGLIVNIYAALEQNIQQSTPALSNAESLTKKLMTPRLGYYGLSDEYYFFSGPKTMLRSFIDKSITTARAEKSTGLSESMVNGIRKADEVVPIDLEKLKEGQEILLGFARAVATVHQSFVSEMISDNRQALSKTCELWNVPKDVENALLKAMDENPSYLAKGGKWEYSYAIGQCVMDQEHDGVKLRNMDVPTAINYFVDLIWSGLASMEEWDKFISKKTDAYRKELIEYLHDALSINGTISYIGMEESSLSDTFNEYEKSGKTCNLCNRGTILRKDQMKNKNSFMSFNFTNRVFAGKTKPDNIYTCIPCGVELALRKSGFNLPGGKAANGELLYFHFIPDYFFTPESWELVNAILLKFSGEARVRMAALATRIFDSEYVGSSPEQEGDVDVYNSWMEDLAVRESDDGYKEGRGMTQYMAQGYGNLIGNASIVFYKPSENNTEFHFFGVYLALVVAAYTGMRVVVSQSPIPSIRGRDFKEIVALDSINPHVTDFYGKFCPLSRLEGTLKSASVLIRLGYNTSSKLRDSLFPKYLRVVRDETLPGSYLLKMVYRNSEEKYRNSNVRNLLDVAIFLDNKTRGEL
ncbi:MAG: type I-D CRISPR-associated protein Cas10d/Csc3 [Methanosarcinales archaeon]|nr:type I-D CRISPR-associated protein Cas10d/Csc3 [Methanosarcinales archaeon]